MTEEDSVAPYDIARGSDRISTHQRPIVARCSRPDTSQAASAAASWSTLQDDLGSWRVWLKESLEEASYAMEKLKICSRGLRFEGAPTIKQCAMGQDDVEF